MSRFEIQGTGDGWVQVVDTEQQEAVAALSDRYHELADEIRDRLNVRELAGGRPLRWPRDADQINELLSAARDSRAVFASGGMIKSPGDPDDDTIGPVLVSPGEQWITGDGGRRYPGYLELLTAINQGYQRVETRARQIASGAMPSLPWDDLPDSVQNWYRGAARRELYPLARPGPKSPPLPEKIHPHAPTTLELAPDSPEGFAAAMRYKARPPMVWRHCSPWLLETGAVDCGDEVRRPCECGLFDLPPDVGHDHWVPEPVALEADALQPEMLRGLPGVSATTPCKHHGSWTCGECLPGVVHSLSFSGRFHVDPREQPAPGTASCPCGWSAKVWEWHDALAAYVAVHKPPAEPKHGILCSMANGTCRSPHCRQCGGVADAQGGCPSCKIPTGGGQ